MEQEITYQNYETFFLLYIDGELQESERLEVENFLRANPSLQGEFDMLLSLKVVPQETFFEQKNILYKFPPYFNEAEVAERLVEYIDKELSENENKSIAAWIAHNPAIRKEYENLAKTVSVPDDTIVFENKSSLYRQEPAKVVSLFNIKNIAAAAVILLVASVGYFLYTKPVITDMGQGPISIVKPKVIQSDTDKTARETHVVKNEKIALAPVTHEPLRITIAKKIGSSSVLPGNANNQPNKEITMPLDVTIEQPTETVNKNIIKPVVPETNEVEKISMPIAVNKVQQQDAVTTPSYASNAITELPESTGKSRMRGLLRKVTRVIEKGTKIRTTDEDDRLLIGALAVHL